MAENEGQTSKVLIVTAAIVITVSILAVVIVLVSTNGKKKSSNQNDNGIYSGVENVENDSHQNDNGIYSGFENAENDSPKLELSNEWEPRSLDYVPEEIGDEIAKSIDNTMDLITDPYEINLFGVNDKQKYAVIIACMYSYENLDKRAQAQVTSYDKMNQTYKELYDSLNLGTANVDSRSTRYGRYSDYGEVNSYFTKRATVTKELYKEGEYFIDSYSLGVERHIFADPTIEWSANYSKTDDIYLYTFDVTFNRVNPEQNEVAYGPVHVYLKPSALFAKEEYAGDVVFNNNLSAKGQFAVRSTRNYTADDFDKIFTYDYGDLEKVYTYESAANVYHHELMAGSQFYNFAYVYGDLYYQYLKDGRTFSNDIEFIYPGENVNYGPGFWPKVYRKGATPE